MTHPKICQPDPEPGRENNMCEQLTFIVLGGSSTSREKVEAEQVRETPTTDDPLARIDLHVPSCDKTESLETASEHHKRQGKGHITVATSSGRQEQVILPKVLMRRLKRHIWSDFCRRARFEYWLALSCES